MSSYHLSCVSSRKKRIDNRGSKVTYLLSLPTILIVLTYHPCLQSMPSCVQSGKRIDNIGSKVAFPPAWREVDSHHPLVPPIFIINFQIPSEFPTSIFKEITDGPGWSLVLYFRMSQVRTR